MMKYPQSITPEMKNLTFIKIVIIEDINPQNSKNEDI